MINNILSKNSITLARALLATSTFITLMFSNLNDLFPSYHIEKIKHIDSFVYKYNFFLIFDNIYIPYGISIISLIVILFGIYPRVTCFIQCYISYSLFHSLLVVEGGDQINAILSLLLIPVCIFDNRFNAWISVKELSFKKSIFSINAKYSLLFVKIQMAILYLNAGIDKLYSKEWSNGTAIYYWFNNNVFGASDFIIKYFGFILKDDIAVSIITFSVIFFEIFLFIGILLSQKRKYQLFIFAVVFHFLIIIIHGLTSFFFSMSAGLILYLWNLEYSINENLKLSWTTNKLFKK